MASMLRRSLICAAVCISATCTLVLAQDGPPALTKDEIAAATNGERISLPMPSELFAALAKKGKPDWSKLARKSAANNFANRQQIALNLGGLVADGYLAVEAKDAAQIELVARDIRTLAKGFGLDDELVQRGKNIVEFAKAGNWDALMETLEATQNEVMDAMRAQKDQDLVILVMLGGWLRGTEVVTSYLSANYTPEGARVLRQPAVVDFFVKRVTAMPRRMLDTPLMEAVRLALFDIHKSVNYSSETTPTEEDVKKLNAMAAAIIKTISTK
jgi:hypothetical protein